MWYKKILVTGAIFGMLAVIFGAFGAHALESKLTAEQLESYGTANDYQFYHALLLLILGIILKSDYSKILKWSSICAIAGIVLFSGSIYVLSTKDLLGLSNTAFIGPITPIGGVFFILSWLFLVFHFYNKKNSKK